MKPIKDFLSLMVGVTLGGEAIKGVGSIGSGMSEGVKGATQSFIGLGIMGQSAKLVKGFFK